MNLRILKKLSKRAAPYLPALGDDRKQFRAAPGENYTDTRIRERGIDDDYAHPLKGTVMVGATEGYYEPEWSEHAACDSLRYLVCCHFTDWGDGVREPQATRRLKTPAEIFRAADEMLAEFKGAQGA